MDPAHSATDPRLLSSLKGANIREHLQWWQKHHFTKEPNSSFGPPAKAQHEASQNLSTQSGEVDSFSNVALEDEGDMLDDDGVEMVGAQEPTTDYLRNDLFVRKGDLVELW